jgi:hypothetical protein
MEYSEWVMELFEEFYPNYDLPFGSIIWNKKDAHLDITWGTNALKLDLREFYRVHSNGSPVESVLKWIYNNVEAVDEELKEAFYSYDYDLDTYSAYVLRPMDTCYTIHRTEPEWIREQDQSRLENIVQVDVNGSIINFSSKNNKIPASTILAYNKYTLGIIENYMDYSPDISVIVPDTNPLNNLFVGHADSIHRLGSDYPTDKISIFTLGQWSDRTNERFVNHEQ